MLAEWRDRRSLPPEFELPLLKARSPYSVRHLPVKNVEGSRGRQGAAVDVVPAPEKRPLGDSVRGPGPSMVKLESAPPSGRRRLA